ncbi:MAG: hypothetical protein M3O92_00330 [Actinomycetota bacterium]|nr:hypothetical protein [Actinomycetota bacterium]
MASSLDDIRKRCRLAPLSLDATDAGVRRSRRELSQTEKEEKSKRDRWDNFKKATAQAAAREAEMKPNTFLDTGRVLQAANILTHARPWDEAVDGPSVVEHEDYVSVMPDFIEYVNSGEVAKATGLTEEFVERVLDEHWR